MKHRAAFMLVAVLSCLQVSGHDWTHHKTGAPIAHYDEHLSLEEASGLGIHIEKLDLEGQLVKVRVKAPAWISGMNVFDVFVFTEPDCPIEGGQNGKRDYSSDNLSTDLDYTYKINRNCDVLKGLAVVYAAQTEFQFYWITR